MQNEPRLRKRRRGENGQVIVEFALASIVFFLVVFGIFDMARLFQSWVAVQHAAREGARYAITGQTVCDGAAGRDNCIRWISKRATTGMSRGGAGASDADVAVSYQSWDAVASSWVGPTANSSGAACDQIEVTVTYRHEIIFPMIKLLAPTGVELIGRQRMTNEPFGTCNLGVGA